MSETRPVGDTTTMQVQAQVSVDASPPNRDASTLRDARFIVAGFVLAALVVAAAEVLFAAQQDQSFLGVLATELVIGGAGLAIGGFLGLLFGVPRLREGAEDPTGATPSASAYQANTNLTEISDWLTKIIVGVSLIQLGPIRDQFVALVAALAPGLGTSPAAAPFVAGLLGSSGMIGFLAGYLLSRIYLPGAFNAADVLLRATRETRRAVEAVQSTIETAKTEAIDMARTDAEAIRLVEQALGSTATQPPQDVLDAAVIAASPVTREYILNRAYDLRAKTWRNEKDAMELSIPVFQALIKANDQEHRPHGQLGYALKDRLQPDNDGALASLSRAITLRGVETGWEFYEFNRALVRIRLEQAAGGNPSTEESKTAIIADLRRASAKPRVREIVLGDTEIAAWATLNKVNVASLVTP